MAREALTVVDASIVLKWFVQEQDGDKAVSLRSRHVQGETLLVPPDIILYELANALRYHPDFEPAEIVESVETIFDLGLKIVTPTASLLQRTIVLAAERHVLRCDLCCSGPGAGGSVRHR